MFNAGNVPPKLSYNDKSGMFLVVQLRTIIGAGFAILVGLASTLMLQSIGWVLRIGIGFSITALIMSLVLFRSPSGGTLERYLWEWLLFFRRGGKWSRGGMLIKGGLPGSLFLDERLLSKKGDGPGVSGSEARRCWQSAIITFLDNYVSPDGSIKSTWRLKQTNRLVIDVLFRNRMAISVDENSTNGGKAEKDYCITNVADARYRLQYLLLCLPRYLPGDKVNENVG